MNDVLENVYAVLPLRNVVIFPSVIAPLSVGREKSVAALEYASSRNQPVILLTQKNPDIENPTEKDLYRVGVSANILQFIRLPDGAVKVLVEGLKRVKIEEFLVDDQIMRVRVSDVEEEKDHQAELEVLHRSIINDFDEYIKATHKISPEILSFVSSIEDSSKLADSIASHLPINILDKQKLLEENNLEKRFETLFTFLEQEIELSKIDKRIRSRVKKQMERNQRDFYLNEQMKAIQKELGEDEEEFSDLEKRIAKAALTKEAKDVVTSEMKRLKKTQPMSAEGTVIRNYIDLILDLPWKKKSPLKSNIGNAKKVLDDDHYGLEKVKERILEYIAVQLRTDKVKSSIICLVGPPGVGKTSLAKSIAKAVGREFIKISLGGVNDESEIRGHRRTYIGSMPGRIIASLKKAKVSNPLILLDEIDKVSHDYRGDPASALLEVLDPEQNKNFNDHYLEIDYDLSDVMFITTANSLNIEKPLLDRMEIINLAGYIEEEKVQIAKTHLMGKEFENNGIKKGEVEIADEVLLDIIRYYTREAGVRSLERAIAKICRKCVREILENNNAPIKVTSANLEKYLGVRHFDFGRAEETDLVGVTTGLAWTEVGGELLSVEAVLMPGKGATMLTGKLGDVMKESVEAARSFVRTHAAEFGIDNAVFSNNDLHIHVPEGATPKDGPSAGIAMCTSIVSILTGIAVRKDIAMTGEITLQGRVLPIGGLKEKLLAALRGGIKTVLIPAENMKDLKEMDNLFTGKLEIIPVKNAKEVLKYALTASLNALPPQTVIPPENKNTKAVLTQ
jgi:ATP-dependent Lon protease